MKRKRKPVKHDGGIGVNAQPASDVVSNDSSRLLDKDGNLRIVTASLRGTRKTTKACTSNAPTNNGPNPEFSPSHLHLSDSEEDDVNEEVLAELEQTHLPPPNDKGKGLMFAESGVNLEEMFDQNNGESVEEQTDSYMDTESGKEDEAGYITPERRIVVGERPRTPRSAIRERSRRQSVLDQNNEGNTEDTGTSRAVHVGGGGLKDKDNWQLTVGIDGGPEDPTILSGFRHHIAFRIWNGQDHRRVLILENRYAKIKKGLKILERKADAVPLIENTCLYHLIECMYPNIDAALVSAFVERWHPETNSFHMPFGEVTILLHDVFWLLGLPIEGEALITRIGVDETRKKVHDKLNLQSVETMMKNFHSGCFKFSMIESMIEDNDAPVDRVAVGFLWWLLGVTLFVEKTGNSVQADFLSFVEDINKIDSYSWGSATLANLYRSLGLATRFECKGMGGCLTLLQAWIYAYFPNFRPSENSRWTDQQPWACKWIPKVDKPDSREDALIGYRRTLDNSTRQHVQWMPFGPPCDDDRLAISRFCGILTCRKITEPYMPRRCMRQFGYAQTIPPHVDIPFKVKRCSGNNVYLCEFKVPDSQFENWNDHVADFSGCTVAHTGQVMHDYLPWFLKRTHPRVTPNAIGEEHEPHLDEYGVRMQKIADMLVEFHPRVRGDVDLKGTLGLIDSLCEKLSDFFPFGLLSLEDGRV